jgi:gamma-glutamyltranspeptidase/glutathione hydrolase
MTRSSQHPWFFGGPALVALGCIGTGLAAAGPARPAPFQASAVATADACSADAAARIFQEGGNAVDAAVTIAFTLAVTYPEAGNIGGGGFMTLYVHGRPYFLDFRERAPLAASRTMYLDAQGKVIPGMSLYGHRAVGVPGTVAGLWQAQRRFGRLSWKQVLAPAIGYARTGFQVSAQLQQRCADAAGHFFGKTNFDDYFGNLDRDVPFRQPELAATLARIADRGARGFYQGRTAALLAAEMHRGHGLITRADLKAYKAVWRRPILAHWNGCQVITAPPPSSGGVGLVQMLKMKADCGAAFAGVELNSLQYMHLVAEIEKRVFADRAEYLGDPDFQAVPVARLTDDAYLARRAAAVDPAAPSDTRGILPGLAPVAPEKPETTHFSVVDKWGNAVATTYTISGYFGSGVVVTGAGFLLNDEMDGFSAKPGVANMYGVLGSDANAIAPGKRMLSSMAPTILTRDGQVELVIGTPGGSRIFTSVFQVMSNLYDFHMPLKEAVAAMRFHHQLLPANMIFWEPYQPITGPLARALEARGYVLQGQGWDGDIQVIRVRQGTPEAAADPRGRGVARIFP